MVQRGQQERHAGPLMHSSTSLFIGLGQSSTPPCSIPPCVIRAHVHSHEMQPNTPTLSVHGPYPLPAQPGQEELVRAKGTKYKEEFMMTPRERTLETCQSFWNCWGVGCSQTNLEKHHQVKYYVY